MRIIKTINIGGDRILINDKDFLRFINDKSLDGLTKERLNIIIDEELNKPEEDMDTALIEYCLDTLETLNQNEQGVKEKKGNGDYNGRFIKFRLKKFIAVAAVVAVILICTVSASAVIDGIKIFGGIVEIYENDIRINFDQSDEQADGYQLLNTELAKELADNGFDNVLLPEAMFSENFEIAETAYQATEDNDIRHVSIELLIKKDIGIFIKKYAGILHISEYSREEYVPDGQFPYVTSEVNKIEVGNTTVYYFAQNKNTTITYRDGLRIYSFHIPISLDEALEFAKTIK